MIQSMYDLVAYLKIPTDVFQPYHRPSVGSLGPSCRAVLYAFAIDGTNHSLAGV